MAGAAAAAAFLRSMTRRSKTPMLLGARSLPRPQPQPKAASAVLSPWLLFDGCRQHLPTTATSSARLFSSATPGSTDKNPSPPCKEPAIGIEGKNKKLPAWELQRQIVYKQGELLQLLLQMHGEPSPSSSDSEKCLKEKEQLIHLLREFQAKTQCKESPEFDAAVSFLIGVTYFLILATIFMLVTT